MCLINTFSSICWITYVVCTRTVTIPVRFRVVVANALFDLLYNFMIL